ncbi:MAG TPA: PQQ-binding-like beta-propeller repeat protein, partial [Actinopolymorphaceae bacterium]
ATFHSTDTAPARPSKPVVPDRAIWQWEAPAGTIVDPDDIAAIPHGVVVQVKDGVLALDAKTGEELWHHRISGAGVLNSASTPSGDLVLVEFATGNDVAPDDAGSLMVALDGRTGEVLSRYVFEELSPMRAQRKEGLDAFGLTDDVFVTGRLQDGLVAHALPYGDPLWKWSTMPEGCESASLDSTFDVIGSAVLIPLACDGKGGSHQIRLIALDATTGRELWRYSSLVPGSLGTPLTAVPSPDGTAAFFRWRWEGDDAGSRSVVLDLETGDELLPPTDGYGYSDLRVARNALMVIDSSGGLTWTPYDGGEPLHMTATCGELPWEAGHHESRVSNSEALVQVCVPDGAKAARVAVLPWRSPREGHTFEVDLAPGTAESQWHDGPHLLEFPELMLVVPDSGDRDRITALR